MSYATQGTGGAVLGRMGRIWVGEGDWRQHSSERSQRRGRGKAVRETILLEFRVLRKKLGDLTLEEIWNLNGEGLFFSCLEAIEAS